MTCGELLFELLFVVAARFENLGEHCVAHTFVDAALCLCIKGNVFCNIDHAVRDNLRLLVVLKGNPGGGHTGVVDVFGKRAGHNGARLCHHLAGRRVDDRAGKLSAGEVQLLIVLITADSGEVVASRVEEQAVQMELCAFNRGRLARTELSVHLKEAFLHGVRGILIDGRKDALVFAEVFLDLFVGAETECADERGHRELSVFIDTHVEYVVHIVFVLQPCAAVRNDGGREKLFACFIVLHLIIDARRTNKLGNDNTFCAVDHKGAGRCHQREITHEDFRFLDLARFLVEKACSDAQGCRIGSIALFAFRYRVIGFFVELVVHEVQNQISVEIRNAGDVVKNFLQTFLQEPVVGIFLNLDQVRHIENFIDVREAHACVLAKLYRLNIHH